VWLGPVVNSASTEQGPALSADGLSLYFYSGRPGGVGSDDIWVSQRASVNDAWGAPVNLGSTINSTSRDFVPAFSADGHWMFFASDRPGGSGLADIYESYRADVHDDFGWQTPTNLGPGVNSAANDNGVGYFANVGGRPPELFFGSDRLGPSGNADLYVSDLQPDGTWGAATRIAELSTSATENRPTLRSDGLEIFFYSARLGGVGGTDLWTATRPSVDSTWSTPTNLGAPVNSTDTELHPYLAGNGTELVFASSRPGGLGGTDLYLDDAVADPSDDEGRLQAGRLAVLRRVQEPGRLRELRRNKRRQRARLIRPHDASVPAEILRPYRSLH
jgi:hypothetical protein